MCVCVSLPDGLDVHGLRVPQPFPGGRGGGQGWGAATVGLAVPAVGSMHVMVVLVVGRGVHMAVVEEQRRVCLCGVHTLHGGVHVVDQLLQVHIIICGSRLTVSQFRRSSDSDRENCRYNRYPQGVASADSWL